MSGRVLHAMHSTGRVPSRIQEPQVRGAAFSVFAAKHRGLAHSSRHIRAPCQLLQAPVVVHQLPKRLQATCRAAIRARRMVCRVCVLEKGIEVLRARSSQPAQTSGQGFLDMFMSLLSCIVLSCTAASTRLPQLRRTTGLPANFWQGVVRTVLCRGSEFREAG